MKITIFLYI